MSLIVRFSRAGTDDMTEECEVEDLVFDFDCVEDATTGRLLATVDRDNTLAGGGRMVFQTMTERFDTITVVSK